MHLTVEFLLLVYMVANQGSHASQSAQTQSLSLGQQASESLSSHNYKVSATCHLYAFSTVVHNTVFSEADVLQGYLIRLAGSHLHMCQTLFPVCTCAHHRQQTAAGSPWPPQDAAAPLLCQQLALGPGQLHFVILVNIP